MMHFTDRVAAPLPLDPAIALLGNEPEGLAMDFCAMRGFIRDRATPANNWLGNPDAKVNQVSPSTKWITNRHGVLTSGTALRCDHDFATLDTSATAAHSLNGSKTLTIAGGATYAVGQTVSVSLTADITKYMLGRVTGWNAGTKALTIAVYASSGYFSGSAWTVIVALGLCLEEQRTNLLTYSQQMTNAAWAKTNTGAGTAPVVTDNHALAPDGTMTAARVQFALNGGTTTADVSQIAQNLSYTSGQVRTQSIWLRSNTGSSQSIVLINFNTQLVVTVTTVWQRFTFSISPGATAGSTCGLRARGTHTADAPDILVWGGQLETGAFATSYIQTTASQATRTADSLSVLTSAFPFNPAEGTMVVRWSDLRTLAGVRVLAELANNTNPSQDHVGLYQAGTGNARLIGEVARATVQASFDLGAQAAGGNCVAQAYKVNDFAASLNGGAALTDASGSVPIDVNRIYLGGRAGTLVMNSHLRQYTYLSRRAANSELLVRSA